MGLRIFEIEFDNPTKTYLAGQSITGKVIVQVDQVEKRISELVLRLWGKAEVSWVDPKNKGQKKVPRPKTSATPEIRISHSRDLTTNDKVFSDEETYFDRRYTILEKSGTEDLIIQPGSKSFPFEITLPSGNPSSFEGEHGHVKYFLEATMKRPQGQYEHNCKSQIYIKGILDLNSDPQAQIDKPGISHEEHLCCLCCRNGPIGFTFGILGNSGVLPGDRMEFLADIYNMSDAREIVIKLKLVQITTYHVQHECKAVKKELLKLKGPSVNRGGTGTWTGESVLIPENIPPTRLAGRCSLISIEYSIEISVEVPRGKKIVASLPIIVGTIPFGTKLEDLLSTLNLNQANLRQGQGDENTQVVTTHENNSTPANANTNTKAN